MKMKNMSSMALQVQFRHMPKSIEIKQLVRQQAERLRRFDLACSRCQVVIDEMHHRHRGNIFKVSIRLTVPAKRTFVAHAEEKSGTHDYLYIAVRLAFDEIERQLEKREKRMRRRGAKRIAA